MNLEMYLFTDSFKNYRQGIGLSVRDTKIMVLPSKILNTVVEIHKEIIKSNIEELEKVYTEESKGKEPLTQLGVQRWPLEPRIKIHSTHLLISKFS